MSKSKTKISRGDFVEKLTIAQVIDLHPDDIFKNVKSLVATREYKLDSNLTIKFIRYPDGDVVKLFIKGYNCFSSRNGFNFQRLKNGLANKLDKPADLIYCWQDGKQLV